MSGRKINKICICGGGNIAHSFIGELGFNSNVNVNVLTRKPLEWSNSLDVYYNNVFHHKSRINSITDNYDILKDADIVVITLPANIRFDYINKIKDYVSKNALLISAPSTGGINFIFDKYLPNNKYVCFERVPYISRTKEYGHSVNTEIKKEIKAYFSKNCSVADYNILSDLLKMEITKLNSYYPLFLSNSNPILHIAGTVELLRGNYPYKQNYPLYDIWNDNTSEYALGMDKELGILMSKLNVFEYTNLFEHYGVDSAVALTKKLKSIPSFKQVMSPLIDKDREFVIDTSSRYIQEDLPFGTCIIKLFSQINNIKTPFIDDAIKKIQPFMEEEFINENNLLNINVLGKYVKNINEMFELHKYLVKG